MLKQLRAAMQKSNLDAYIVFNTDPHQSEYTAKEWKMREWISGFTGSNGTAVILKDQAALWTDHRYIIQAQTELSETDFSLFMIGEKNDPTIEEWLYKHIPSGGTIGVNGEQITVEQANIWQKKWKQKKIQLILDQDLITPLWKNRPRPHTTPIIEHPLKYAGASVPEKLTALRKRLKKEKATHYLLSSLYDIAWLFNIRANDLPHCPVARAYALIDQKEATLFLEEKHLTASVKTILKKSAVSHQPYSNIKTILSDLPQKSQLYFDPKQTTVSLTKAISCQTIKGPELTTLPKAIKNETQIKSWKNVHLIDAVAMIRFWKWLEETLPNQSINEWNAAKKIDQFRLSNPTCKDLSFSTISAYGSNAAIVHYAPKKDLSTELKQQGLYLLDSGGQYFGGTTDITRTLALGKTTHQEQQDYTLVLKGLIHLSSARFPKGTTGANLDILARQPLWKAGLDFKHGTGHGVGYYLNVHEGPQSFSQNKNNTIPLESGMVITIEPGIYRKNSHGIRLENMVYIQNTEETEFGTFQQIKTLTCVPFDTTPLDLSLLTPFECNWINQYHKTILKQLTPLLSSTEQKWLAEKTAPIFHPTTQ